MLGQDKSAKARYDFSPYGELMRSAGLPLTVGYTGHRWDPAIGQYFAPFRFYNPQTARWNMRDPLNFVDGPNVYGYVAGNPTNGYDPLGLSYLAETADDWFGGGNPFSGICWPCVKDQLLQLARLAACWWRCCRWRGIVYAGVCSGYNCWSYNCSGRWWYCRVSVL